MTTRNCRGRVPLEKSRNYPHFLLFESLWPCWEYSGDFSPETFESTSSSYHAFWYDPSPLLYLYVQIASFLFYQNTVGISLSYHARYMPILSLSLKLRGSQRGVIKYRLISIWSSRYCSVHFARYISEWLKICTVFQHKSICHLRKFQVTLKVFKALTMRGENDIISQKTFLFSDECAFMK